MRARICLITPGHLATNPRLVKEADALSEAGFEVLVIAADFLDWAHKADAEVCGPSWKVVATHSFGSRTTPRQRAKQRLRQRIAQLAQRFGLVSDAVLIAAWHPIGPELVKSALAVPADLYIAHYVAALPAAARAAALHGAAYAFDAEDFHQGDLPDDPEHAFERRAINRIEQRFLPGAAYVTAASQGIALAYAKSYGIPAPTTVLNVFSKCGAPTSASDAGTKNPRPSIYWFSQTIGANRGLECAVEAIARAKSRPHLYLRGELAAGYRRKLLDLATKTGVADRIHFEPIAQPKEMVRLAALYDVGLVGETGYTESRRIALTNKQFTYILVGIPAVMSDISAHTEISRGLGPAMTLYETEDPDDLARALDQILTEPGALAASRKAAFELGRSRFNWEAEASRLVCVVTTALRLARPAAMKI